ncbi:MAG TPA: helix-turn-helix domain-containing protein [Saprospiraceae bacterium]|nr:helix-turn-helix domain-containing protein [Saprospiraceae bacterium]
MEMTLSARCPMRTTIEMLGGKWRLLLIYNLRKGPLRPSELKQQLPQISDKVLNDELHFLTTNHLLRRTASEKNSRKVFYELTDIGRESLKIIEAMEQFGLRYEKKVVLK